MQVSIITSSKTFEKKEIIFQNFVFYWHFFNFAHFYQVTFRFNKKIERNDKKTERIYMTFAVSCLFTLIQQM